jgi:hypothetical protein
VIIRVKWQQAGPDNGSIAIIAKNAQGRGATGAPFLVQLTSPKGAVKDVVLHDSCDGHYNAECEVTCDAYNYNPIFFLIFAAVLCYIPLYDIVYICTYIMYITRPAAVGYAIRNGCFERSFSVGGI